MNLNVKNRTLFCCDNLEVLQGMNSESVDLIYLDPPFNKKKKFTNVISTDKGKKEIGFKDIFRQEDVKDEWMETIKQDYDGLYNFLKSVKELSNIVAKKKNKHYLYNYCYLVYMAMRLLEMQRILKDTGKIYLHCDPTMSHYLKILMDIIFGEKNFRNEIVWHYRTYQGKVKNYYPKKHDIIFLYVKNEKGEAIKNLEYQNNYMETVDYKRWKKFFVDGNKIKFKNYPRNDSRFSGYLKRWHKNNNRKPKEDDIIYECKGYVVDDVFTDIQAVDPKKIKERTDWETQKPLKLLERIIKASSNEGDVVLDPFCGCATTCVAAELLGRKWIGIDIDAEAYRLVKERALEDIPSDLFDIRNINSEIKPPKRTDLGKDYRLKKYVYVISNPKYPGEYKVGIAKDMKSRLNSYQTSDPDRNYKIEYKKLTEKFREIEKFIHQKYENKHEWVLGNLKTIIQDIEKF